MLCGYRVSARLTQETLAERAGLSVNGLRALEAGWRQAPHRDTVEPQVRELGLTGGPRCRLPGAWQRRRERWRKVGNATTPLPPRRPLIGTVTIVAYGRGCAHVATPLAMIDTWNLSGETR
jgi:hypothetical protein